MPSYGCPARTRPATHADRVRATHDGRRDPRAPAGDPDRCRRSVVPMRYKRPRAPCVPASCARCFFACIGTVSARREPPGTGACADTPGGTRSPCPAAHAAPRKAQSLPQVGEEPLSSRDNAQRAKRARLPRLGQTYVNEPSHSHGCLPRHASQRCGCAAEPTLNVGSKRFTESYILGEIIKQTAQGAGETTAVHQQGLGNTAIVLNALTTGSIDVHPEYTGTIARKF